MTLYGLSVIGWFILNGVRGAFVFVFLVLLVHVPAHAFGAEGQQADTSSRPAEKGSTDPFHAEVLPSEIKPGDAFLVRVTGISSQPAAVLNNKRLVFSKCGEDCFIAIGALPLETGQGAYEIAVGTGVADNPFNTKLTLHVKHLEFPVIRLTLPEEKVTLSSGDLKRARMEAIRLRAMWSDVTGRLWEGGFIMPLENSLSTGFGVKRIMNRKKTSVHRGVDIRGKEGSEVRASNRGRVALTEELFFGGNTVVLDHGDGIYTIYMHLSKFNVSPGQVISKGDVVGLVGSTGRATGPHLHFGVRVNKTCTNPVSFAHLPL